MELFLLFLSVVLSNLSVFTIILNGLDSGENVAGFVCDRVQQGSGVQGRAEKSHVAGHWGRRPGLRGQLSSHPWVTWHFPSEPLIGPSLRHCTSLILLKSWRDRLVPIWKELLQYKVRFSSSGKFLSYIVTNSLFLFVLAAYFISLNPHSVL